MRSHFSRNTSEPARLRVAWSCPSTHETSNNLLELDKSPLVSGRTGEDQRVMPRRERLANRGATAAERRDVSQTI
jgi:hypothetical protein